MPGGPVVVVTLRARGGQERHRAHESPQSGIGADRAEDRPLLWLNTWKAGLEWAHAAGEDDPLAETAARAVRTESSGPQSRTRWKPRSSSHPQAHSPPECPGSPRTVKGIRGDMIRGGASDSKPGEFTDYAQMGLTLAASLQRCDGYDPDDVWRRWQAWVRTPSKIWSTTRSALEHRDWRDVRHARPEAMVAKDALMRAFPPRTGHARCRYGDRAVGHAPPDAAHSRPSGDSVGRIARCRDDLVRPAERGPVRDARRGARRPGVRRPPERRPLHRDA